MRELGSREKAGCQLNSARLVLSISWPCVLLRVCLYVNMCECVYVCMCLHVPKYVCVCRSVCGCERVTWMCISVYVCWCVCVCVFEYKYCVWVPEHVPVGVGGITSGPFGWHLFIITLGHLSRCLPYASFFTITITSDHWLRLAVYQVLFKPLRYLFI